MTTPIRLEEDAAEILEAAAGARGQPAETVVLLAGRSLPGIESDARKMWPEATIHVVADPGDCMAPASARTSWDRWSVLADRAVLVANGGRTGLQVEAILVAAGRPEVAIVDLQRDGVRVLRRPAESPPECCGLPDWDARARNDRLAAWFAAWR